MTERRPRGAAGDKKRYSLLLPPEMLSALIAIAGKRQAATTQRVSVADLITQCLEEFIAKHEGAVCIV